MKPYNNSGSSNNQSLIQQMNNKNQHRLSILYNHDPSLQRQRIRDSFVSLNQNQVASTEENKFDLVSQKQDHDMMLTPMQKHSSILMIPKRRETVEFDLVEERSWWW